VQGPTTFSFAFLTVGELKSNFERRAIDHRIPLGCARAQHYPSAAVAVTRPETANGRNPIGNVLTGRAASHRAKQDFVSLQNGNSCAALLQKSMENAAAVEITAIFATFLSGVLRERRKLIPNIDERTGRLAR
jgi:hypothetical protein